MPHQVPSFFVYGEPDRPLDVGFLHVETVMERATIHSGRVAAHKHDRMAQITFWMRGEGQYFIEDDRLDFVAPAISFVPSGSVHGFTVAPETSDAIVASIADSALVTLDAICRLPLERPLMVRGRENDPIWHHVGNTMNRLLSDYRAGATASLAALVAVALNDIARLAHSDAMTKQGGNDLAQEFRKLVDGNFRNNWAIDRFVEALGTTPHLLAKACQVSYGQSVKTFIDQRRLLEARRLLLFTVRSVEDIAYEIGFQDPAYFSRFFRKRTGQPPGEWRVAQAQHRD